MNGHVILLAAALIRFEMFYAQSNVIVDPLERGYCHNTVLVRRQVYEEGFYWTRGEVDVAGIDCLEHDKSSAYYVGSPR